MKHHRRATDAADRLFAATGNPSVDQRLAGIAATATALLDSLEAGTCTHGPMVINRWARRHLDLCSRTFCRPAPVELVELIGRQLGADRPQRAGRHKNTEKHREVVTYALRHPSATVGEISRATGYYQKTMIKSWLKGLRRGV